LENTIKSERRSFEAETTKLKDQISLNQVEISKYIETIKDVKGENL